MNNKITDFEPCTLDEVADALCFVNGDSRDTWILMGCAVKNEFGDAGYSVWDQWSAGCDGYDPKKVRGDWKAIKAYGSKGSVTIASLFKEAISNGYVRRSVSDDDRARLQAEAAQRAVEREKEKRIELAHTAKMHGVAAHAARAIWERCKPVGKSPYLGKKQVQAHGVGFARMGMVLVIDDKAENWNLLTSKEDKDAFWSDYNNRTEAQKESISGRAISVGVMVVPMVDESGEIQNLQLIYQAGAKKFLTGGKKSGCWHLMGEVTDTLIEAEGYATGATIHEATGLPVAVCFDSGNMPKVAVVLRKLYPAALMMMAADDDKHLEAMDPPRKNAGLVKAKEAARLVDGYICTPKFAPIIEAAA